MINDDLWYPVTPENPPPLIQVRGIVDVNSAKTWQAHIIVSRGRSPHQNQWAEWIRGNPKPLPPTAVVRYWQPQAPEKWRAPLPPPAKVSEAGLMHSEGMRFQAVADAEATELAREMEADREMARTGGHKDVAYKEGLPWWRDASLIRYEPAGAVTPRMAEGRVMRAVALCGHDEKLTISVPSFSLLLARMAEKREQMIEMGFSDVVPRLQALPQDGDDFLTSMMWFVALNPVDMRSERQRKRATWNLNRAQMIMLLRSFDVPISFDAIGADLGISGERARKAYKSAINRCVRVANGLPAYPHLPDQNRHIEDLRERNRTAKRAA